MTARIWIPAALSAATVPLTLGALVLTLAGCETLKGAGRDIYNAGETIDSAI